MFIVVYHDEYEGNIVDEYSHAFPTRQEAEKYANEVNKTWAEANDCTLADIGTNLADYYVVIKVTLK